MLIRWLVGLAALGATVVLVAACDDRQYRSSTHVADTGDTPGGEDTGDTSPDGPDDATDQDTQSQDTPPFDLGDDTDPPPPGGVTLVMHNVGELPVYLEPLFPDTAYLGVQILTTQGEVLPLSLGCRTTCDECQPIQCEPPEPRVRQLLPGDTLPFDWDGTYFEETQCTDVEAVACRTRRVAARGEYVARVCWTTTLETQRDRPPDRRRDDDTLAPAWLRDVECGESRFLLGRDRATHQLVFSPRAVEKQHGYCGRAWTYDNVRFPSFAGGIPRPREGETVAIPLGQEEITAQPCHRLGNVGHFVDEGGRYVGLRAGRWLGTRTCAPEIVTVEAGPVARGEWNAVIETFGDLAPSQPFTVESCPACLACPDTPTVDLGGSCSGDCQCRQDAACVVGICTRFCRSGLDCRADQICTPGDPDSPGGVAPRCRRLDGDQCARADNCDQGQRCATDGNAPARCLPDLDTRLISEAFGRSFHCGCDAECPGVQSCVRFQFNFTQAFCAIRCADSRDCPEDWDCLGETSSGLEAICVPQP